ncbi:General stress protein 39 [Chryseobacterium taklimakanense]|uniref:General stress protein 39 n=1 Tax=Chryseobacterium taklimakanense TaxID=536441 RepID=A0A239WVA0_9FLAO|nr:SDR family oxidoreductase [Chryseobacterium taklimakanense]SNV38106.1 General stress protein 39 [Chryseobacterium taklimakanense]
MQKKTARAVRPPQSQNKPGTEKKMNPVPESEPVNQSGGKLQGKVAIITGGDSGIGKATAILFAQEGCDVVIPYLSETTDAKDTQTEVEQLGQKCVLIKGDLGKEPHCKKVIDKTISEFGKLDILVNNAANHWESKSLEDITTEQMMKTFHSNVFSVFWLTKFALKHLKKGGSIINTVSVTAYRGSGHLIDYASTKGAVLAFTRSLSANLAEKGIRVNAVAPGPIWTPLIASTFSKKKVSEFGSDTPMKRAGQPNEVATCFLFLALEDSSYITGQVLHPNGGEIVNG